MQAYDIAVFTHRGTVRSGNEDAVLAGGTVHQDSMRTVIAERLDGEPHSLLVADGIGGQPEGALASRTALHFLASHPDLHGSPERCEAALHAANDHLYEMMDEPGRVGMGTTIVGVVVHATALLAFNVGDSSAYRLGRSGLIKLSQEDTAPLAPGGKGPSHAITQSLGGCAFPVAIEPHVSAGPPMHVGERFMLCSDGLTDVLDDEAIAAALRERASPSKLVERLVRQAIAAGTRDNISVVVAACV
jgi:serine/threonine protein phosphatase PrpC